MLQIIVPGDEFWDESKQEFVVTKEQTLQLEHSLVSLSKWESKWRKSFFSKQEKTTEETIDYIKFMTLTKNVDPDIYSRLSMENVNQINEYIENPMTATTFPKETSKGKINGETVTAELVYYWMIALNIPFECQKWHLLPFPTTQGSRMRSFLLLPRSSRTSLCAITDCLTYTTRIAA